VYGMIFCINMTIERDKRGGRLGLHKSSQGATEFAVFNDSGVATVSRID